MRLAGLCKGSTADSDSVCEGSNPSPAARRAAHPAGWAAFLFLGDSNPHINIISARSAEGASRVRILLPLPEERPIQQDGLLFYFWEIRTLT